MAWIIHDPLTHFIAQIAAITVTTRLIGLLLKLIGQPFVIAEMIGGILLGPSLLGWVAPDVSHVLFAPDSLNALKLVGQLGLVFFMFLIGLQLELSHQPKNRWTSIVIAQSGMVAPFLCGCALAYWMYPHYAATTTPRIAFILFIGTAMSVTAFPVLARILSERNLLGSRLGMIVIACAAIDDISAWCLLAFVVAVARSSSLASAALTTGCTLGFIALMVGVVRPLLARWGKRQSGESLTQNAIALVIVLVLVSSWTTELIGIHALFGGFLLGVIVPRTNNLAAGLARRFEDVIVVVFLPLFFAYSGLRTQIGLLGGASDWAICGLIIFAACAGKLGGCSIAARLTGSSWRDAGSIGILMNTRGLMELVVLNIGYDLGIISPVVFSMMVLMALVTTLAAVPLLRLVQPRSH